MIVKDPPKRTQQAEFADREILEILEQVRAPLWFKLLSLSIRVEINPADLLKLVINSDHFVTKTDGSETLIASRKRFRLIQPWYLKLIAAFKNSIV